MKTNLTFVRVLIREFSKLFLEDAKHVGNFLVRLGIRILGTVIAGFLFRIGWEICGKWGLACLKLN